MSPITGDRSQSGDFLGATELGWNADAEGDPSNFNDPGGLQLPSVQTITERALDWRDGTRSAAAKHLQRLNLREREIQATGANSPAPGRSLWVLHRTTLRSAEDLARWTETATPRGKARPVRDRAPSWVGGVGRALPAHAAPRVPDPIPGSTGLVRRRLVRAHWSPVCQCRTDRGQRSGLRRLDV